MQLGAAYGMSETCPLISAGYINLEDEAGTEEQRITQRIKAGVPGPLVEAQVIAADGSFLPKDGVTQGELVLRAPCIEDFELQTVVPGDGKEQAFNVVEAVIAAAPDLQAHIDLGIGEHDNGAVADLVCLSH